MALGISSELKGSKTRKKLKTKTVFVLALFISFSLSSTNLSFYHLELSLVGNPTKRSFTPLTHAHCLSLSLLFFFFELSLLTHFTRGLSHSLFTHKSGFLLGKILVLVVFSYEIRCFFSEHFGDYFGRIFVAEIGYRDCMTYFFFFFYGIFVLLDGLLRKLKKKLLFCCWFDHSYDKNLIFLNFIILIFF